MITLFFLISFAVIYVELDKGRYLSDSWYGLLSVIGGMLCAIGVSLVGLVTDFGNPTSILNPTVYYALSALTFLGALLNWFVLFALVRYRLTGRQTLFEYHGD